MNKNIIIIAVLVLIVLVGLFAIGGNENSMKKGEVLDSNLASMNTDEMKDDKGMDSMNDENSNSSSSSKTMDDNMSDAGKYQAYSKELFDQTESSKIVLFFHASWCPSCRGLNSDIESNLNNIPKDLTIFKADYDKEVDMKKKYGVTHQHTLVQVDKDGNMIKKWSGSPSLNRLVSEIK